MKKKIFSVSLVAMLIAAIMSNGTLAYFTDIADKQNVFTMGKVNIDITEDKSADDIHSDPADPSSPVIAKGGTPDIDNTDPNNPVVKGYKYSDVLPGSVLHKEPVITVQDDSVPCYLIATVSFKNTYEDSSVSPAVTKYVFGQTAQELLGDGKFLSGGVSGLALSDDTAAAAKGYAGILGDKAYVKVSTSGDTTTVVFAFKSVHDKTTLKSETLFDKVAIPAAMTNTDADKILDANRQIDIKINGYAIQSEGVSDVFDAAEKLGVN